MIGILVNLSGNHVHGARDELLSMFLSLCFKCRGGSNSN